MSYGEPTTFVGDVTGSGHTPITLTMSPSGVAAGTYGGSGAIPIITVDEKGRVTNVSTAVPTNTPSLSQAFLVAVADTSLPNARPLVAGTGITLTDNGSSGMVISRNRQNYVGQPAYYEPFWGGVNSYFVSSTSGSGASIKARAGTASAPGGVTLTVAGSTDRAVYTCSPQMLVFGGGVAVEFQSRVNISVLGTGSQSYSFRDGFLDSTTTDALDGVYFEYDSTQSPNWRICTSNNSTRTKVNTSVAVAINTAYELYFIVNSTGTLASFYINGTPVGSIATNIPIAAGRETGLSMQLLKSKGNNAVSVDVFYMFFQAGV